MRLKAKLKCGKNASQQTDPRLSSRLFADQRKLSKLVSLTPDWIDRGRKYPLPILVAGCDVTFSDPLKTPSKALACIAVMNGKLQVATPMGGLKLSLKLDTDECDFYFGEASVGVPYIPGLLAYRELPPLLIAYRKLKSELRKRQRTNASDSSPLFTLFILDGQGVAHPRRFGLACHFGVRTGEVCIGCAKSRLIGRYSHPPIPRKPTISKTGGVSHWFPKVSTTVSPLWDEPTGEQIGTVIRVRSPFSGGNAGRTLLFVSPGHRINTDCATALVLQCFKSYVHPEPLRLAHNSLRERS